MNERERGLEAKQVPRALEGTPLYVHLPFCAAKCHYCDFYSVAADGQDVDGFLGELLVEIEHRAPRRPGTVFLGGGTPSLLSVAQLRRLFAALEQHTSFRSSASEVTAECNPESLDRDKAAALLELGVTRLSIGFQSLDSPTLELFGRVHSVEQSFRAYQAARDAGANNVNVDLIYATPQQTLEQWERDLDRILALGPNHVSAYNLTFEEQTPFRRWLEQGRLERLPEELELDFFWYTRERLGRAGLLAYEISNFSSSGRLCAHNVNYWHNGEYLGVGPSAVSKLGGTRAGNARNLGEYRRQVRAEGNALAWHESPDGHARLGETWWLGLRLSTGLSPAQARTRAGVALDAGEFDWAESLALRLLDEGWLERDGENLKMSRRGLPLADAVAREFVRPQPAGVGSGPAQ